MKQACLELVRDERGTATSEFVILLVCIAVGGVAAWRLLAPVIIRVITG